MDREALIGQLEDGRIIKLEDETFTELINGKWVEPEKDFTAIEFMDYVDISDSDIKEMLGINYMCWQNLKMRTLMKS